MFELQIIGNIGKDAEIKNLNGKDYIIFSVCHSEKYTDTHGQTRETATWVSCYKSLPSNLLPYLKKGTKVFVRGSFNIKVSKYQGKDYVNINCQVAAIQLLSSKQETADKPQETPFPPAPDEEPLPY